MSEAGFGKYLSEMREAKPEGRLGESSRYMFNARLICRRLPVQTVCRDFFFALLRTVRDKVASTAIIAITVSSSIRVKALTRNPKLWDRLPARKPTPFWLTE